MRKKCTIIMLFLCGVFFSGFAQESPAVKTIRDYYNETMKRIGNEELYCREITIEHAVIPAIGTPVSRIVIDYDLVFFSPGEYDILVLKIEHYYQHAGMVFYEECLYNEKGDAVFCFDRSGNGSVTDPETIDWDTSVRYYFSRDTVVRVIVNGKITDNPGGSVLRQGQECLRNARLLLESLNGLRPPQPFIFLTTPE